MRPRLNPESYAGDRHLEPEPGALKGGLDVRNQPVQLDRPLHQSPNRKSQRQDQHGGDRSAPDQQPMRAAAKMPRDTPRRMGAPNRQRQGDDNGLVPAALTGRRRHANFVGLVRWNRYRLTPQAKMASPLRSRPMRTCSPSASPPGTRRSRRQATATPTAPAFGA